MTIYYIQYEAEPLPHSKEFATCGGAYVNCWVQADSATQAISAASSAIEGAGWRFLCVEEECREVTESRTRKGFRVTTKPLPTKIVSSPISGQLTRSDVSPREASPPSAIESARTFRQES
jgi:hypothetical protein